MIKRVIVVFVLLLMVFSLCACSLESYNLQKEIDDLNDKLGKQQEQILKLEDELNKLTDKLEELKKQHFVARFYTLEASYESGLITRDDLMHIVYYFTGSVYEVIDINDDWWDFYNWQKIDFVPKKEKPELDPKLEQEIKQVYYERIYSSDYTSADLTVKFYGEYNGSYAVRIDGPWDYPAVMNIVCIDGIIFTYGYPSMLIFTYENA